MKRLIYLSTLCFIALSAGCSYNELPEDLDINLPIDNRISLNVETRAEVYNGIELDREYFVTASDLEKFVEFRCNTSKRSNFSVKEVKSYGFDSSQTLFYILNYNEGWEVVAADKRIQPTLAHGDSGAFTMDCDNEPMKFWMNMLADGILQTRLRTIDSTVSTTPNPETFAYESTYVNLWEDINSTNGISEKESSTKVLFPQEYRYLIDTEEENVFIANGPLLATKWGQDSPWNTYCPLKTDNSGKRAPTGCVAVAASQTLYYLRNYFDLTLSSPTSGYCEGNIDNYNMFLTNVSVSAWDDMAMDYRGGIYHTNLTALLMSYIGLMVDMNYGNNSSSATTMDLPEMVFDFYGIDCETSDEYDSDQIIQNIIDRIPVIIKGRDAMLFGGGHAWVVDGYGRDVIRTTKYYIRSITPLEQSLIETLDKDDANISVINDVLLAERIHMNWGWDGWQDSWFALPPEEWWIDDGEGDTHRYRYFINTIHSFQPTN